MTRVKKNQTIVATVIAITLCVMLAGCGGKGKTDSAGNTEAQAGTTAPDTAAVAEPTYIIDTPCGGLAYPETWKDKLETEVVDTEVGCDVAFYTTIGENRYHLFTVVIGGEDHSAGMLTAADGTVRNVSLVVSDLGDLSALSQSDQDQLYAMQEGLNVVVENLS